MEANRLSEAESPGTTLDANQTGNFVYVLRCRDESLYTGWTNRLEKRLKAHQEGTGAKYTRTRKPVQLLCYWQFQTSGEARRFEIQFKRLSRIKKLQRVNEQRLMIALALGGKIGTSAYIPSQIGKSDSDFAIPGGNRFTL